MPFPGPTDKVTIWLATDETHHQVECLFSLAIDMIYDMHITCNQSSITLHLKQCVNFKKNWGKDMQSVCTESKRKQSVCGDYRTTIFLERIEKILRILLP